MLTGGTTAARVYPELAHVWPDAARCRFYFSDERCVPPTDDASNFAMAKATLLDAVGASEVHRMEGELDPTQAADRYHDALVPVIEQEGGFDVMLLGLGADAHVGALFPDEDSVDIRDRYCAAVARPDGLMGLTLTPPAMLSARRIIVIATGESKAEVLPRVLRGDESPQTCPVRLLDGHPAVTLATDRSAASLL